MFKKTKILLVSLLALSFIVSDAPEEVDAWGEIFCNGGISGTTLYEALNPNGGQTYFGAVDALGTWFGTPVPMDILGFVSGFAPSSKIFAACSDDADDNFDEFSIPQNIDFTDDEYIIRGYAWNDVVGFISFYCDGATGDKKNEGAACGDYDYFVRIGKDDGLVVPAGKRPLTGYAWNAAYGYISMDGDTGGGSSIQTPGFTDWAIDDIGTDYVFQGEDYNVKMKNPYVPPPERTDVTIIHEGSTYNNTLDEGDSWEFTPNRFFIIDDVELASGDNMFSLRHDYPPITWQVMMDSATGDVEGYGFTDAGVWLNFEGMNIQLPGAPPVPTDDYCDGRPWVCLEVNPDPRLLSYDDADIGTDNGIRIANGEDPYYIDIYLRTDDGVTSMVDDGGYDLDEFFESLKFYWEDTVKIEQFVNEVADSELHLEPKPWAAEKGGINYKPVGDINDDDPTKKLAIGDFENDPDNDGNTALWRFEVPITSFTPTSNANLGETSGSAVPFNVSNESFPVGLDLGSMESNDLILDRMTFELLDTGGTVVTHPTLKKVIFPNGKNGLSFWFRPAIELKTLYADNLQDAIVGLRATTVIFTSYLRNLPIDQDAVDSALLTLKLAYSRGLTEASCIEEGADESAREFDFYFTKDLDGNVYSGESQKERPSVLPLPEETGVIIRDKLDKYINFRGIAEVPLDATGQFCSYMQDPSLYSEIRYQIDGQDVGYYSNKLPRLAGLLANPAALIDGTVIAQIGYSPGEIELDSFYINVESILETIDKNIVRNMGDTSGVFTGGKCIIKNLESFDISCADEYWTTRFIGNERVYYFNGSDVILDLQAGWSSEPNQVIIVEDGNLFIDGNIYNDDGGDQHLGLVVTRGFGKEYADQGNIYVDCDVTNIQANMVVDGTLYSYCRDQVEGGTLDFDAVWGEPEWDDFGHRVDALSTCQLSIEGSLASKNTLGGAERAGGRTFYLKGTGLKPDQEDDMASLEAQNSDLNFLRVFRLELEKGPDGPIDKKCARVLSPQDLEDIYQGETLCGEIQDPYCDPNGLPDQPSACDGITLEPYDPSTGVGDLVLPESACLAQGLEPESYGPLYIKYVPAYADSFVFTAPRGVRY